MTFDESQLDTFEPRRLSHVVAPGPLVFLHGLGDFFGIFRQDRVQIGCIAQFEQLVLVVERKTLEDAKSMCMSL